MNNKSKKNSWPLFVDKIADYIDLEYGGFHWDIILTDDEKYTISTLMHSHFYSNDSINNTANEVMNYLKKNRSWNESNGIHKSE